MEQNKTDNLDIDFMSDLYSERPERLIGKTIARIEAGEYNATLIFEDGSSLEFQGTTNGDSSLYVDFEESDANSQ